MKLSDVLKGIKVNSEYTDVDIVDITADSRKVCAGFLFVCIKGASFDGHTVAEDMMKQGAVAVVAEHDLGLTNQVLVDDSRAVLSEMCANFFSNPAETYRSYRN